MVWSFRGWTIESKLSEKAHVLIDKEEENLIVLNKEREIFLMMRLSIYGEGFTIEKNSLFAQANILPNEKKIILSDSFDDDLD